MLSIQEKAECPKARLGFEPIDELLASSLSQDKCACDALLDLRLAFEKRENPDYCVETFFALNAFAQDARQGMLLQQLRLTLMTQICMEAYQLETGDVSYHRVDFEAESFHCFVRRFICRYYGVTCCRQCPEDTLFRMVFVPE